MLPTFLLLLGVLATVSIAKNPYAQRPGVMKNNTACTSNDQCDPTTVGVTGGGQIQVADCFAMLEIPSTTNFSVQMSDWHESTDLPDKYQKLFTIGSCELAVKRTDCGKDAAWIGKSDLYSIINQSVELAKTGDGDQLETTHGEMNCTAEEATKANIEWTLRQTANGTGNGNG